mmetsp:Transcript_36690/g.50098  ORF Transcript_36690/g.50098 Transcript_36690/m.50098 type:complete len:198 (+) Transcript_36690:46-639(+)
MACRAASSKGSGLRALRLPAAALEVPAPLPEVEPCDLPAMLYGNGTTLVIDVRTADELADGHIAGCQHIPFDEWNLLSARAEDLVDDSAAASLLRRALDASPPWHLIFHCMYSRERGPRAAEKARVVLGDAAEVSLLRGGFQQCMAQLWPADGDVLASVREERWRPHGRQGLVWIPDIEADAWARLQSHEPEQGSLA